MRARFTMRGAVRASILVAWAALMVALVGRSTPDLSALPALEAELPAEGTEDWQGIYKDGKKVGWAHRRRVVTPDGFAIENEALVRLTMMGAPRIVRTHVVAHTDSRLRLRKFDFRVSSGTLTFEANGVAEDGALLVRFPPDEARTTRIPLSAPIVLPQTLHEALAAEELAPGKRLRYSMFDPLGAAPVAVELEIGERVPAEKANTPVPVYEVTERFRGSELKLWVDDEGEVLREEGPLGLVLVREDEDTATAVGLADGDGIDVVSAAAIPIATEIVSPREVRRLGLRVDGIPEGRALSFPPRQTSDGGRVRIESESESAIGSFELPQRDSRFLDVLGADPFVQSDDPRIRAKSEEILAGERDAERAARKLLDWVHRSVAKVPMVTVPNALGVLDSLRGDCNEHAVLYAALARAAGLPARIAAGTVYMPAGEAGTDAGAFFYHAWVEVWLGEWVAVDPTFGQFPADATHVKLLEGGPETHAELLAWIGRLSFSVEDYG